MPLYDYDCRACGARFDVLVGMSHADDVVCARCGSADVKRLLPVIAGLGGRAAAPAAPCGRRDVACGNCPE